MKSQSKSKKEKIVKFDLKNFDPKKYKPKKGEKSTAELNAMTDDDIDFSDIPASEGKYYVSRNGKINLNIVDIEPEIYKWFSKKTKHSEIVINHILKNFIETYKQI